MGRRPQPLFICGFPSGGTDLLKNILNAHPAIFLAGEFPLLPSLAASYEAKVAPQDFNRTISDIVECDYYNNLVNNNPSKDVLPPCSFADLYLSLITTDGVAWAGNKTPQNAEHVDKLERLFPGAHYILIVRDVRDVALSWRRKWGKDIYLCADKWNRRMLKSIRLLTDNAPDRHLIIHYEDLLSDEAAVARTLCDFLAVDYSDRMTSFSEFIGERIDGKLNYGEPIIRSNMEKWRNVFKKSSIRRLEEISYYGLEALDYKITLAKRPLSINRFERFKGLVKDAAAIVLVGNRAEKKRSLRALVGVIRLHWRKYFGRYRLL